MTVLTTNALHILNLIDRSGDKFIQPNELLDFIDGSIRGTDPDKKVDRSEEVTFLGIIESTFTHPEDAAELFQILSEIRAGNKTTNTYYFSDKIPTAFKNPKRPEFLPPSIDVNSLVTKNIDYENAKCEDQRLYDYFYLLLEDKFHNQLEFEFKIHSVSLYPNSFEGDILLTISNNFGETEIENYPIKDPLDAFYFGEILTKIARSRGEFKARSYKNLKPYKFLDSVIKSFAATSGPKPTINQSCLEKMVSYSFGGTVAKESSDLISIRLYLKPSRLYLNICPTGMALHLYPKKESGVFPTDFTENDVGEISIADIIPDKRTSYSSPLQTTNDRKPNKVDQQNLTNALPLIYQHKLAHEERDDLFLRFFVRPLSAISEGNHLPLNQTALDPETTSCN